MKKMNKYPLQFIRIYEKKSLGYWMWDSAILRNGDNILHNSELNNHSISTHL